MDLKKLKEKIKFTEDKILSLISIIEDKNVRVECIDLHYGHSIGDEYGNVNSVNYENAIRQT